MRLSANTRGAILMVGAMAGYSFNDAMVKLTAGAVPLFQLIFLRGVLTCVLIYGFAWYLGAVRVNFPKRDWLLVLLRSVSEILATVFFLSALFRMELANVTAVLQVLPLTVTLGAAIFFGERVGWRRWCAILVGFVGMLLILRPGPEGFTAASAYSLIAVLFVTARDLSTRGLSRDVPALTVSLVGAITLTLFAGAASLIGGWEPVSGRDMGLISIAALFLLLGYVCSVAVMRTADIAVTAPFRYSGLLWALILGLAIWGEWPEPLTLLGAAIVVLTGLYTLVRERRQARVDTAHGR